jgi:hypothetical protein
MRDPAPDDGEEGDASSPPEEQGTAGHAPARSDAGSIAAPAADSAAPAAPDASAAADARSRDVAVSAPPIIECKVARYCDDFEVYKPDAPPAGWSARTGGGGTITVDETRAFSGTRAIHIKVPGGSATAQISRKMTGLPVPGNNLYGRMMVYLQTPPPGGVHYDIVEASGTTAAGARPVYYIGINGKFHNLYQPHSCYRFSNVGPPANRWFCLRWQFDGSDDGKGGTRNVSRTWLDTAANPVVNVDRFGQTCEDGTRSEWIAPVFSSFTIGWANYQKSPNPTEMWLDDIAFDNKPLDCPAQ